MEGIDGSGSLQLPDITTEDAKVNLKRATTLSGYVDNKQVNFDMAFTMEPEGVDNVSADQKWDLLFWYTYSVPFRQRRRFLGSGRCARSYHRQNPDLPR